VIELRRSTAIDSAEVASVDDLLALVAGELLPFAAALTGGRQADAHDLLQESLIRVHERIDQLRDRTALLPWARRVMMRVFLSSRRRAARSREVRVDLELTRSAARIEPAEDLIDLRAAVDRLPRPMQLLLVLHYWMGLSLPECAREIDIPVGTAKSRLSSALARLRGQLGDTRGH
jgi:RNA polymerase sigma factor (sigma-70 family)